MKIAVITNYDTTNYGSILQAYALQTKLKEYSSNVYILYKKNITKKNLFSKIKKFVVRSGNNYSIKDKIQIKKAKKNFIIKNKKLRNFCDENLNVRMCSSLSDATLIVGDRDILIAGSDQIWSYNAGTLSKFTTLQFGPKYIKRYSYAASIGTSSIDSSVKKLLEDGLSNFSEVSVRESSAITLINSMYNKKIHCNIDPTFLYDISFWSKILKEPSNTNKYIFVYMLRPEPLTLSLAQSLAEKTGLKIYLFSNRIIKNSNIENITNAGLEEFLGYIKNASYVITNSFHGTAFCIQFQKQFISVAISGSGMRVTDLLSSINLENRIATNVSDISIIDDIIDWNNVNNVIEYKRKKAIEYIERIVENKSIHFNNTKNEIPILFRDKSECCACGACKNACPKNAITMKTDEFGFFYPKIDEDLCIKCGNCKRVCNYQNNISKNTVQQVFAAISKEENIRMSSSSGGVFTTIAKSFLLNDGIVFGCSMEKTENGLAPVHIEVGNIDELYKLQSSKYAQSDMNLIYRSVKKHLKDGKNVLFSGTPCQIDGLKGYLNNISYENLYTIDLICHGVPNASILQGYIKMLEDKKNINIYKMNFRDKKYGWGEKGTIYYTQNNKHKELYFDNYTSSFYNLYLKAGFYRENCYSCRYANIHRVGDITIGDFWGIQQQHPEYLQDNWEKSKGISCILINTPQGEKMLKNYGNKLDIKNSSLEKVTFKNKMLLQPSRTNSNRNNILEMYIRSGYVEVDKWFWKTFGLKTFIYQTWDKIPLNIRNKIKKYKTYL